MKIGGLQKTTLIDYPGKVACTVFLMGCNFRCPWCYSSELVIPEKIAEQPEIPKNDFFEFLEKRKTQLDGVVVCGGEPTINSDLPVFCQKIKDLGYLVKLDTNGSNPDMVSNLINNNLVDYIAMDIKAPKEKYPQATGLGKNIQDIIVKISKTISILKQNKVDYEFRTTFIPEILSKQDILEIAKWISPAKKYYIQNFVSQKTLNRNFSTLKAHSDEEVEEIQNEIKNMFDVCEIR